MPGSSFIMKLFRNSLAVVMVAATYGATVCATSRHSSLSAFASPSLRRLPGGRLVAQFLRPSLQCMNKGGNASDSSRWGSSEDITDHELSQKSSCSNRRAFILSSSLAAPSVFSVPLPANAVKGAAEYDLEYYLRDIVMGNKPEGNLPASNAPPLPPPRKLQGPLLPLLLDDELQSCMAIQELALITKLPASTLSEQIKAFRTKVQPAFGTRYPWKDESASDEYYFDLTCYSLWKIASMSPVLAENYAKREEFVRNIGRRILNEIISHEMISKDSIDTLVKENQKGSTLTLTGTIPCVVEILELFQSAKYCSSYRLGDKNDEERTGLKVFDELDDEEISSTNGGGSVNCLVSIFNPSTLGGALQITGEGSRFAPDFVGPILAAVWERVGGDGVKGGAVAVSYESYFVDPVYRPNPKDFFPDERFYQFTITKKN